MPLTSDHERFFRGFNADSSDDHRRAYTPPNRDRGHRTNTPGRASGNTHRMNERTSRDEAHLNRYNMSTRGPRFQPRVIADRHHHDSSELSSSSSREWSVSPERHSPTPTPPPDRNLGHSNRSSRSNSPTPRQFEHSRSSYAPSRRSSVTTPSLDHSSYGSSSSSHLARNVSGGHCLATAYLGSQGQGSRGSSSGGGGNHSSSRNSSDRSTMRRHGTRQETPLRSTSTVSTSNLQTPLMSNIFTNDNTYSVDSHDFSSHRSNLTDLGLSTSNPPTNTDAVGEIEEESLPTDAEASYDSVGVDEQVPGQIDTNQGANGVSPGGLTGGGTGASYHTARSHNPSIVSDFPPRSRASTRETRGRRSVTRLDL
jgi:hypothetical protein